MLSMKAERRTAYKHNEIAHELLTGAQFTYDEIQSYVQVSNQLCIIGQFYIMISSFLFVISAT